MALTRMNLKEQIPRPGKSAFYSPVRQPVKMICRRSLKSERIQGPDQPLCTKATAALSDRRCKVVLWRAWVGAPACDKKCHITPRQTLLILHPEG